MRTYAFAPHMTGLLTLYNRGPIEDTIQSDPKVRGALLFGRGKPFNGALIEPSAGHEVSLDDAKAVDAFLDSIWYGPCCEIVPG